MNDLIERLEKIRADFSKSPPTVSWQDVASAMGEAAEALKAPLPEEVAGLIEHAAQWRHVVIRKEMSGMFPQTGLPAFIEKAAAALERQAREIERLNSRLRDANHVLGLAIERYRNAEARIRGLEVERDEFREGWKAHMSRADKADADRAAIEAATIARCIADGNGIAKAWSEAAMRRCAENNWSMANTNNVRAEGAMEVVEAIRALAHPAPAAGPGCPKCGGLRQWPMGCVIRLPDSECGTQPVDALGIAGDFVGHAGYVKADASNLVSADDAPAAIGAPSIDVRITAADMTKVRVPPGPLGFPCRFIVPAKRLAELYREAVNAEMSESVKKAVNIKIDWLKPGEAFNFGGKRALVEVSARHLAGVSDASAAYLFELRDAIDKVISDFVPPLEAWVVVESEMPQGAEQMGNTIGEIENVLETITNTTDPVQSVETLVDWVAQMFSKMSSSPNPAHAAVDVAAVLQARKSDISAAVMANTQQPQDVMFPGLRHPPAAE